MSGPIARLSSRSTGLIDLLMRLVFVGLLAATLFAADKQQSSPNTYGDVDAILNEAVQSGLIPGAVLIIGHNGQVIYRNAYGSRALVPQREPMTVDTIFDAASLTKVVATTPSLMKLFE